MKPSEFIIDNETINLLTGLMINRRLYYWNFTLDNNKIDIRYNQETGKDLFGYPIKKQVIIHPNILKNYLKGHTLMQIRDSIVESKPETNAIDGLYMSICDYCDDMIRFIDNKIMEIKFNKLFEENVKLKESINQINDKFSILIDAMELNKKV